MRSSCPLAPRLAVLAVAALLGAPSPAHATDCAGASRASTCIDADALWARPGLATFVGIAPTATLPARDVAIGVSSTYVRRPVTLRLPSSDPAGTDTPSIDNLVDATLLMALGLGRGMEADLAIPIAVYQDGLGVTALTQQQPTAVSHSALRDPRLGASFELVRPRAREGFGAAAHLDLALPLGARSAFAGSDGPTLAPSLSAAFTTGRLTVSAEIGARLRKGAELLGTTVGPQLREAVGARVAILQRERLSVQIEAFSLQSLSSQRQLGRDAGTGAILDLGAGRANAPSEWLFGVRSAPLLDGDLSILGGFGTGLALASGSVTEPRLRAVLELRFAPGVSDTDADGVPDASDACPDLAEDRDGYEDTDGCPDPDNDHDGVPDVEDRCPNEAGPRDNGGCPVPAALPPPPAPPPQMP